MKTTPKPIEIIFVLVAFLTAAFVLVISKNLYHGDVFEVTLFKVTDSIPFLLKADSAGMVFACVSSFLFIPVSFYAIGYMRKHEKDDRNLSVFYICFAICVLSAVGIALSGNLVTFFVFYEILTIATWPLVFHERDEEAVFSGRKYLIYTLIPGQLLLIGIVMIYAITGSTTFVPGGFVTLDSASAPVIWIAFIFMFMAGAVKAGMMPLQGWLPSAMVAPTPVSALLHAVAVVKAGAFCVVRVMGYTFDAQTIKSLGIDIFVSVFACFTIICASLIAMRHDNLKRRLAYSTVGQLSYIILGMAMLNPYAMVGSLFHIVAHAVMKITLFMCAGAIMVTTHKTDISQMKGLGRKMPITFFCFTIASLGIAGMPFIAGFLSKWNLGLGAYYTNRPIYIIVLIASALLSLSYLIPISTTAFLKKDDDINSHGKEAGLMMLVPICITAALSIILGIWPDAFLHLYEFAREASYAVMGGF